MLHRSVLPPLAILGLAGIAARATPLLFNAGSHICATSHRGTMFGRFHRLHLGHPIINSKKNLKILMFYVLMLYLSMIWEEKN